MGAGGIKLPDRSPTMSPPPPAGRWTLLRGWWRATNTLPSPRISPRRTSREIRGLDLSGLFFRRGDRPPRKWEGGGWGGFCKRGVWKTFWKSSGIMQKNNPIPRNYKTLIFPKTIRKHPKVFRKRDNPRKSRTPVMHHPLIFWALRKGLERDRERERDGERWKPVFGVQGSACLISPARLPSRRRCL